MVLFITHGGAGSFQETVCHKTPIVGIPISADQVVKGDMIPSKPCQHMNVAMAVQSGIGLLQDWHSLKAGHLLEAVQDVRGSSLISPASPQSPAPPSYPSMSNVPLHPCSPPLDLGDIRKPVQGSSDQAAEAGA